MRKNELIIAKIFTSFFVFVFVFYIFALPVNASIGDGTVLKDKDKKEIQFWNKIQQIKNEFGDEVDAVALASTILYEGNTSRDSIYNEMYDRNYDESKFGGIVGVIKDIFSQDENADFGNSTDEDTRMEKLYLATIIMVYSSKNNGGTYSDEAYKKALAGNTLISYISSDEDDDENNDDDKTATEDALGDAAEDIANIAKKTQTNVINKMFCSGKGSKLMDGIGVLFSDEKGITIGDSKKFTSGANMADVCKYGYIGATRKSIRDIKNEEIRQKAKEKIADEILEFAELYRKIFLQDEADVCDADPTASSGDFSTWKQCDEKWGNNSLGGDTICHIGCLVTSVSIQIAKSGTKIEKTSGKSDFNPGVFVKEISNHGGVVSGGGFAWKGFEKIAPNVKVSGSEISIGTSNEKTLAKTLKAELSKGAEGKYQKYIVLRISYSGCNGLSSNQHWVAVDEVSDSKVTIMDPAMNGTTLNENYCDKWTVHSYRVLYATDVKQGKGGTSDGSGGHLGAASCGDGEGSFEELSAFINNFEGGRTCNGGKGYTTSILPDDPGGLTAANGMTLATSKYYAKKIDISSSEVESQFRSGCPDKKMMDKIQGALLEEIYDEVNERAGKKGLKLNNVQLLSLTSIRYSGSGMDSRVMDYIKKFGVNSHKVFNCMVSINCGFDNGRYMDGLSNKRAGEYELYRTGNFDSRNLGLGYSAYQTWSSSDAKTNEYAKKYWPSNEYMDKKLGKTR